MALSKVNFNSLNVTPSASKALKFNSSNNGLETGDVGGSLVLISETTASSDSTISFTGIDTTYKELIFKFINIHSSSDNSDFVVNFSDDSSSHSYNLTKTTTYFGSSHDEGDSATDLGYFSSQDLAQSTDFQQIFRDLGAANDESCSGILHLFDPSNQYRVKQFISVIQGNNFNNYTEVAYVSGYVNTTAAITAVQFKIDGENIASGTIKMYGVS